MKQESFSSVFARKLRDNDGFLSLLYMQYVAQVGAVNEM